VCGGVALGEPLGVGAVARRGTPAAGAFGCVFFWVAKSDASVADADDMTAHWAMRWEPGHVLLLALDADECRVARGVDGEDLGELGHVRHACDLFLLGRYHEHKLLAARVKGARGPDEGLDHAGVDEAALAEVDEHCGVRGGLLERSPELGRGAEVVLAAHVHHRQPGRVMGYFDGAWQRLVACGRRAAVRHR